jgi:hypothetical protein
MEMEMEMEQPGDWLEKHENWVHRGTHTHNTYLEPEQQVYEGYGMADEPPETATSPGHDVWPNDNTIPIEYERQLLDHGTRSPDWEHTTATNPEYDDETSARAPAPVVCHAVEPHIDDTIPFEGEGHTLWREMQAADEEWAAAYAAGPNLLEEQDTGMCNYTTYSPPPSPTSWHPTQPQTTSYHPIPNHSQSQHPHPRYYRDPPRAPRQRYEYRPPRPTRTRRERYRPPPRGVDNRHSERRPPRPPYRVDHTRYVPPSRHPHIQTPQRPQESTPRPPKPTPPTRNPTPARSEYPKHPERPRSTPPGSWRERPPHPHPPRHTRSRSDSLDWREARPGRPISVKPSPSPPTNLEPILKPPTTPKISSAPPITPDLESLVIQASMALQGIIGIAGKLVRRVNAQRRIAHKGFRCARPRMETCLVHTPHVSSLEGGTCDRVK